LCVASEDGVLDGISNLVRDLINESISSDGKQTGLEFLFNLTDHFLPVVVPLLDNNLIITLEGFQSVSLLFIFSLLHF